MGVPTLGCDCAVCTSADPHDRRLRPSALVRWKEPEDGGPERVVVIDTGPDFREQALRAGLTRVDAVLLYPLPRRPHSGAGRSAPAELYGLPRGRPDSALCHAGDGSGAGARLRVHLFAAGHLSQPRASATGAAGGAQSGSWRRVPARSGAAWRDGDCGLSLWPCRLPDRRERHSRSRALRCWKGWTTWCSPRCATNLIPATPRWSRRWAGRGASARGRPG